MSTALIQTSFIVGEVSPSLFGHVDLARLRAACSTGRNGFVSYRGGFYSRAGTSFVGFSKQTGRAYPPRLISFQFSINQGLALEFGNLYMRVISDGAFVTEAAFGITNITQANPAVVTISASGVSAATPVNSGVVQSYAAGDTVTIAGGTYTIPAVLNVTSTEVLSLALSNPGTSGVYAPGNTITLAGGTHSTAAVVTVTHTQVLSAGIAAGGGGGLDGHRVVTGTTGTGTVFTATVHISGGVVVGVDTINVPGDYTVNPTNPANEPIAGASLVGAALNLQMGALNFGLTTAGVYTVNAAGGAFTQASTSGTGVGATFDAGLFGPHAVTVATAGVYTTLPANPAAQASTSGSGLGGAFNLTGTAVTPFANGDWAYIAGVGGMTQVNGETYVVAGVSGATFQLTDVYGNNIDSTAFSAYTAGGTAARIFTLATIYAEQELAYLKVTESADVMSLCCVNQMTQTEYQAQDLSRLSDTNWVFTPVVPAPSVAPPAVTSITVTGTGNTTTYDYVITAVSPVDGTESVASAELKLNAQPDIAAAAGTVTLQWQTIPGVAEYNIYKATPGYAGANIPGGVLFGYAGTSYGNQFIDSNIVADFSQVPPQHRDPFARGQIISVSPQAGGSGYTVIGYTINTSTGSGADILLITSGGALVGAIVRDPGENYGASDTITITGDGSGATATLQIGPQSGTYPSVPAYFQERRAYANSLNNPDTYWMSQPGAFTNYDFRIPTIDTDAITGSPWAVQVNGIQWMIQTSGGLLVFTGLSAWLLVGTGSFATNVQAISPASQAVTPQAFSGCSATVPPIKINYDVIYVSAKGSFYFDLPYQLYALSEPIDITENSSHLFTGFTIKEHAWCEQPYKLLWAVRDDGILLSLTYYKTQQVAGWARSDTNGLFESVCSVTEPPVDALYLATQRFPPGHSPYMIERMDNRIWADVESTWCVDCGLTLAQPEPAATLTASSATGLGAISGVTGLVGGTGYSAGTSAAVVDDNGRGPGTGAIPALTIVAGVITAISFAGHNGTGYVNPRIDFTDPANTGSGAAATLTLDNSATFTASAGAPFASGDVGSIIRMGGGMARITTFTNAMHVVANILSPIVELIPNTATPLPQTSGNWTMTAPVTTISGLRHLAGMMVTGLADGNVITPRTVSAAGQITLDTAASAVTVGLGFQAQLQTTYLEAGQPTVQGQRKKVADVTVRLEASRGVKSGTNQVDGSTQSPMQNAPTWYNLADVPDDGPNFPFRPYNALATPLRTGDIRLSENGGFATPGQVCFQQDYPLPMQVLAPISEVLAGDLPQTEWPKKQKGRGA